MQRLRRLRGTPALRDLVRETRLQPSDFVYPVFACTGEGVRVPIDSMPGVCNLSVDLLVDECREAAGLGIAGAIVFGIPASKDPQGSDAYAEDGIVQAAVRALKRGVPRLSSHRRHLFVRVHGSRPLRHRGGWRRA